MSDLDEMLRGLAEKWDSVDLLWFKPDDEDGRWDCTCEINRANYDSFVWGSGKTPLEAVTKLIEKLEKEER